MELKEFVKTSLLEIVSAVSESQNTLKEQNSLAIINPMINGDLGKKSGKPAHHSPYRYAPLLRVKYDLMVTETDSSKKDGGAGISVIGAKIGFDGSESISNTAANRIQFEIHLIFPSDKNLEKE